MDLGIFAAAAIRSTPFLDQWALSHLYLSGEDFLLPTANALRGLDGPSLVRDELSRYGTNSDGCCSRRCPLAYRN
jgi:hypothetical protein